VSRDDLSGLLSGALQSRLPRPLVQLPPAVWEAVRELRHILPTIALLWLPAALAVAGHLPGSDDLGHGMVMLRALLVGGLAPLLIVAGAARLRTRSWGGAVHVMWEGGWLNERALRHVLISISFAAFFWAYACWKSAIPHVNPFGRWDERLWTLGAWIHGGQPDVILAPWFGGPRALVGLDWLYESWWFVLIGTMLYEIWQPRLVTAKRFLLAFVLTWTVLGIFLATAFASTGPCYARFVTGTHRYDVLIARLQAADAVFPLLALRGQAYLWSAYTHGVVLPGGGVSAFPSLHVAGATLCALGIGQRHRGVAAAAWLYVMLTFIASIMLGWHYVLDGEVAVLGAIGCWKLAGWLTADDRLEAHVTRWTWRDEQALDRANPITAPSPAAQQRNSWTFYAGHN
jgi:hypothetical protein